MRGWVVRVGMVGEGVRGGRVEGLKGGAVEGRVKG